jgi:hypothetical protein
LKTLYFFTNTLFKPPIDLHVLMIIGGKLHMGKQKNQHALTKKKKQLPSQTQQKQYEWNGDSPLVASGDKPASKSAFLTTDSQNIENIQKFQNHDSDNHKPLRRPIQKRV